MRWVSYDIEEPRALSARRFGRHAVVDRVENNQTMLYEWRRGPERRTGSGSR